MITKIQNTDNPYGSEWLEKLRQELPTISRLNISERRFLIDGNRKALYITGHKVSDRKAYIGMTKIYLENTTLKIKTTVSVPHLSEFYYR